MSKDPARDAGEIAALMAHVREAYNDIRPHNPPVMPFVYWDPDYTYSCAAKLISRYSLLQTMARQYDKTNDFAKKWGQRVKTQANNERSAQIRVIKAIWLNNDSHLSFTSYDHSTIPPTVSICQAFADTNLGDGANKVENLQALLHSDSALSHPVLYDYLCSGLESGNFKNTDAVGVSTISDLCSPSHEAHIRAELWFTLPHWNYCHSISKAHSHHRIDMWKEFLELVVQDRHENEVAAHALRLNSFGPDGTREAEEEPVTVMRDNVDQKFW
jgi:hypothetical protein